MFMQRGILLRRGPITAEMGQNGPLFGLFGPLFHAVGRLVWVHANFRPHQSIPDALQISCRISNSLGRVGTVAATVFVVAIRYPAVHRWPSRPFIAVFYSTRQDFSSNPCARSASTAPSTCALPPAPRLQPAPCLSSRAFNLRLASRRAPSTCALPPAPRPPPAP